MITSRAMVPLIEEATTVSENVMETQSWKKIMFSWFSEGSENFFLLGPIYGQSPLLFKIGKILY